MRLLKKLFESNENWSATTQQTDPEFFQRLSRQQSPEFLWIGCSDSRVPANEIVGLMPGELFVHRNIANIVNHLDMNCLAVIDFAVNELAVRHIMVVGHYGCGGVKAAMQNDHGGIVGQWLTPIREMALDHAGSLEALPDGQRRWDRLCELNVIEQVRAVVRTTIVRNAWAKGQDLAVHGWIYGIQNGRLRDLSVTITSEAESDAIREKALQTVTTAG